MITSGRGRHRVWLRSFGPVYLLGGSGAHIGAVSVCAPGGKAKSFVLPRHKDHIVTSHIAARAADRRGGFALCLGGIHVDCATKADIRLIVDNCYGLGERI